MRTVILILNPAEIDIVQRATPSGEGEHAELLRKIQEGLDVITGELTLPASDWLRIQKAATNWRLGYERQFKALTRAADRGFIM